MNGNATIGDKIKFIRELRGYKQDFIATQLGISQNGYGKIERGETDVPYSRLEQISEVLNISLEDLVSISKEKAIYSITNHSPTINTQSSVNHQNQTVDIQNATRTYFFIRRTSTEIRKVDFFKLRMNFVRY